jgi:hypothetical protein
MKSKTYRSLGAALSILGPIVSCDVETDGINPLKCKMLCCGMSDGRNTVVVWPWKPEFAAPLSKFLASRERVIFHHANGYDLIVLEQHGVVW